MTHIHVSTPQDAEAAIREVFRQTNRAAIDIHVKVPSPGERTGWNYDLKERHFRRITKPKKRKKQK